MYEFIDAHTHAQFSAYDSDRNEVIDRARKQGIIMVNVGTETITSKSAITLAHSYATGVYATVGLHPVHTAPSFNDEKEFVSSRNESENESEAFNFIRFKELARDEKVVAIGECGLDYFHLPENNPNAKNKQKEVFMEQMKLSREIKKPLMIHCRDAFGDLIEIFTTHHSMLNAENPGIIHFFTGTLREAEILLDLGFYFTFGGAITYPPKKNGADYASIIKMMPFEKILSETDAPYVAPVPHRGKRNEPLYVIEVVKKLA